MIDRQIAVEGIERWLNALELFGIIILLLMAFTFQFVLKELPCPLCLLQRIGFLCTAMGLLLNLRFGLRPSHYALTLLSALFTAFVALRQVSLHVVPGTGDYGSSVLGLHMYTWSFLASMVIVVFTTLMLSFDIQYTAPQRKPKSFRPVVHVLFACVVILAAMNLVSVLAECGVAQCPDNPVRYLIL